MTLLFAALAVAFSALIGGATGFASSLLATPALLLLGYDVPLVVTVNLSATLVSRILVVCRSWRSIEPRRIGLLVAGSAPGAVLGALTVGLVPAQLLRILAGVTVAALGLLLLLPSAGRVPGRTSHVATGLASGYLATSVSLNGPPVAALLSRADLPVRRFIANLACYFITTNLISLAALALSGGIPAHGLLPLLPILLVAAVAGNQLGTAVSALLPRKAFKVVVAVLVIASGVATACA
ncbi:sulfite exporter TauE/SafE family protein [Amycolatopsis jiangsuensis]|uniref:Probable membrane transporter protein n=1 Tax=Amycolatopsis jiangsuensis TaxID=1181879 RepID=A0A840ISE1_9PSEU|nr:sulfite exporter TauE/SafE family protein [Amycolatopsis jiangsuensis]MBB4684068.1 putative membrane protein YfcA [Amycolatopsis jiangsuensis]